MRLEPLGERAFLMIDLPVPAPDVAQSLADAEVDGLLEIVPSYETVGLYIDPDRFRPEALPSEFHVATESVPPTLHSIPVCYTMGEDLEIASRELRIEPDELAALHASTVYGCAAIGFCPGFPYLGPLPSALSGLARLADPRVRVPQGSVAITGKQTGIYTLERPGGWWLIGRTPLELVNVADAYFPISPGDRVKFEPIDETEFARLREHRL